MLSKRTSIQKVFTIPFVIQLLVITGIITGLALYNAQQTALEFIGQIQNETNIRINGELLSYLTFPHELNRHNALLLASGDISFSDKPELVRHFYRQNQAYKGASAIFCGTSRGELYGAERGQP